MRNRAKLLVSGFILFIFALVILSSNAFAQEYVLPYPGFMPGSNFYKFSEIVDRMEGWWSFGNFAKFKYHLSMADKKLVEGKTLFEYKQYLLGVDTIGEYEKHLRLAKDFIVDAQSEGKNISEKKALFQRALKTHAQVLNQIKEDHPKKILWQPEKESTQTIEMEAIIFRAIETGRACGEF